MNSSGYQSRVEAEVKSLHADLALWLSGRCAQNAAWFDGAFSRRFHNDFFNIQPAGVLLTRSDLLEGLRTGYGGSPDFAIRIRNVVIRDVLLGGRTVVATYEEYQRGAKNSRSENARLSTALFAVKGDDELEWRCIHETWLPDENHDASNFLFS